VSKQTPLFLQKNLSVQLGVATSRFFSVVFILFADESANDVALAPENTTSDDVVAAANGVVDFFLLLN
jgi:hypothetical protein